MTNQENLWNDAVSFTLAGDAVVMRPGECWYLDLTKTHAATNTGSGPRVHLVIDAIVDPWLEDLFGFAHR